MSAIRSLSSKLPASATPFSLSETARSLPLSTYHLPSSQLVSSLSAPSLPCSLTLSTPVAPSLTRPSPRSGLLVSQTPRRSYSDKLPPLPRQTYTSKAQHPSRYPTPQPTAPPPESAKAVPDPHWGPPPSQEEVKKKSTAWSRYLQRGLPNWAIGCMFAFLLYQYGYEKAAQWGYHDGAAFTDKAAKMERATAARDAYLEKIAEEKRRAKEILDGVGKKKEEVEGQKVAGVLLPGGGAKV